MNRSLTLKSTAALGLLLGALACQDDTLLRPATLIPVDPQFVVYVSMGNSITAGFQSGGINDSTQVQSYANLIAGSMHTPFFMPLLNRPGCPAPFTNIFTQTRVSAVPCAFRKTQPVPPPFINDVAVPGAEVIDAIANLDPSSNANALTTLFLGGLTQTQMMDRAHPTFVSVWLGNNEVLGALEASDTTGLPSATTFHSRYAAVLDSITKTGAKAVLMGVGLGDSFPLPFFSRGTTYFGAKLQNALPPTFTVLPNCAPPRGDSVWIGFPTGGALLAAAAGGAPVTLDCADTTQAIQPAELVKIIGSALAYNQAIAGEATARNWAYVDMNAMMDSMRAVANAVRAFPLFGQPCSVNPFGTAFSCDGLHPSGTTHKLIANRVIQAINAQYGTHLGAVR
jgi:hypothetical protein